MPSKKQRVEATLVNHVLGDPYLGKKIKMYAICAELQEAVNHAAYALHYPFVDWPNEFDDHFGVSDANYPYGPYDVPDRASYKPSAFILYRFHRYSTIIPPPPSGTYGTLEEMEAHHERDRKINAEYDSSDYCTCCEC